jgi:hypothetical protein
MQQQCSPHHNVEAGAAAALRAPVSCMWPSFGSQSTCLCVVPHACARHAAARHSCRRCRPPQGTTALWRPRWLEFPELVVRADVVVRGPRAEAAITHFAALLEADLSELVEVPVYFADSLALVDPAEGRGQRGARGAWAAAGPGGGGATGPRARMCGRALRRGAFVSTSRCRARRLIASARQLGEGLSHQPC